MAWWAARDDADSLGFGITPPDLSDAAIGEALLTAAEARASMPAGQPLTRDSLQARIETLKETS
jgi:hypothetical protein